MEWKIEMVLNMFSTDEAASILSIPLSKDNAEDRLIWDHSSLGDFTVYSAYIMARTLLNKHVMQIQDRSHVWMPKVKFFIWKLMWNILPVASNLSVREISINNKCMVCAGENETFYHTFLIVC
ncbi:hypothetical protein REPUB_Repub14bG0051900 [Reevesia pubescens]